MSFVYRQFVYACALVISLIAACAREPLPIGGVTAANAGAVDLASGAIDLGVADRAHLDASATPNVDLASRDAPGRGIRYDLSDEEPGFCGGGPYTTTCQAYICVLSDDDRYPYGCSDVPLTCYTQRSCACLGNSLCPLSGMRCEDAGENRIRCVF